MSPYDSAGSGDEVEQYRPEGRSVARLRDWADAARAAYGVAQSLVRTSFVPEAYRGKPDEATAAILAGFELGFDPIASLNAFSVIKGRAAPNALTLRAVVQSKGHEMEIVETTPQKCIMRGRRRGADRWQSVTWTIGRARDLQLIGKDQWKKQPQNMLVARATSELARLIAADAVMGIPYVAEELFDQDDDAPAVPAGRRRRATPVRDETANGSSSQMAAAARTPDGRPLLPGETPGAGSDELSAEDTARDETAEWHDEAAGPDDSPEEAVDVDTPRNEPTEPTRPDSGEEGPPPVERNRRMRAVYAALRQVDAGDRHEFASRALGKPVTSYGDLTADELGSLLDAIDELKSDQDSSPDDQD
jgi:hypothetical protein